MTIERAAKAMQQDEDGFLSDKWEKQGWDHWRSRARAALEAIAEPTPEMIEAGQREFEQSHWEDVAAAVWRGMHAAMLKQKEAKE